MWPLVWLSLSCWIIASIPPLSVCFAPSSASSQSPAEDPRKSCCFSLPAYIIPTYSYVILCNVFAAAATFKTISLPVRLYAEMNRAKWIVLTANEQKCVCYYHRGICSHHNCTGGLVSSFGAGFCDLTHHYAIFLSEKLFQRLDFSLISPMASSAAAASSVLLLLCSRVQRLLNWFYIQVQSQSEEMNLMTSWRMESLDRTEFGSTFNPDKLLFFSFLVRFFDPSSTANQKQDSAVNHDISSHFIGWFN